MLTTNRDINFDGDRAFLPRSVGGIRAYARCCPSRPENQAPERSQFRFEVPACIVSQGGRCRNGRCDCFPASHKTLCRDPLLKGPQVSPASLKRLIRLMRNLFKITRSALAVNARGYSWLLQQIGNTAIYRYASIPAKCLHPALSLPFCLQACLRALLPPLMRLPIRASPVSSLNWKRHTVFARLPSRPMAK